MLILFLDKLGIGDYNGETMVRLDADKFAEYKAQAIEELTAAGVTFRFSVITTLQAETRHRQIQHRY